MRGWGGWVGSHLPGYSRRDGLGLPRARHRQAKGGWVGGEGWGAGGVGRRASAGGVPPLSPWPCDDSGLDVPTPPGGPSLPLPPVTKVISVFGCVVLIIICQILNLKLRVEEL